MSSEEFRSAAPDQLDQLAVLASGLLEGSLSLAGRARLVASKLVHANFFHHWGAHYDGEGHFSPTDAETGTQIFKEVENFPAWEPKNLGHNNLGLSIVLPQAGVYLDASAVLDTDETACMTRFDLYKPAPADDHTGGFLINSQPLTEVRAQRLLDIVDMVAPVDPSQETAPSDKATAKLLQKKIEAMGGMGEGFDDSKNEEPASPETLQAFKASILKALANTAVEAFFLRNFQHDDDTCMIGSQFTVGVDGNTAARHGILTAVNIETGQPELLITSLILEDGKEPKYSQHTETDVSTVLQEEGAVTDIAAFHQHMDTARGQREEQTKIFESEKALGFHQFSQADAERMIEILEDPGTPVSNHNERDEEA